MTKDGKMFDTRPNQPLGETKDHYWLVQRMARANGTDLVSAAEDIGSDASHNILSHVGS